MQSTAINGTRIHFRTGGEPAGPTLVFVNSLGTDWRVWETVAEHFATRCRLVFYDKRGHGLSDLPEGPLRIADHVADLAGLADTLEIESALVCGLSVGGMIALGLAEAQPKRVRGLVLCDTGHRIGAATQWNQRIEMVDNGGMQAIADDVLERWFSADFRAARPAETGLWRNMLLRTPSAGYTATCAAIRDADLSAAARAVGVPVLCLCGGADQATPPALMRELDDLIPDSRYQEIPGACHLPTVERAGEVVDRMHAWLEERLLV